MHFLAFSFEVEGPLRRTFASTYGNGRDWIPLIFEGRQPPLHENSPELRAVKAIFNRDNEVSETFANQPQAYRPIFMTDDGSIVAREWALGFVLGVGLRSEQWGKRVLLSQHRQLLIPILVCCEAASTSYLTGNVSREETAAPPPPIAHDIAAARFLSHRRTNLPARQQPALADHGHQGAAKTSGGQICGAGASLMNDRQLQIALDPLKWQFSGTSN